MWGRKTNSFKRRFLRMHLNLCLEALNIIFKLRGRGKISYKACCWLQKPIMSNRNDSTFSITFPGKLMSLDQKWRVLVSVSTSETFRSQSQSRVSPGNDLVSVSVSIPKILVSSAAGLNWHYFQNWRVRIFFAWLRYFTCPCHPLLWCTCRGVAIAFCNIM